VLFNITIKVGYRNYILKVERTFVNERNEIFCITTKSQKLVLKNNRPLFRNRGLKHRNPDWEVIENSNKIFSSVIRDIANAISKVIDNN
jgi:hypothetical protein